MTKLDFAIHLFSTALEVTSGHTQRLPTTTLLVLMELSRHPAGTWRAGHQIAEVIGRDSNAITCCTRGAVAGGLLIRRPGPPGGNQGQRCHEWSATPAGLALVKRLLDTSATTTHAVV